MNLQVLIGLGWKSALCAGIALALLALMRRHSASQRALAAHPGVLALVLLPFGPILLPKIEVEAPARLAAAYTSMVPQAGSTGAAAAAQAGEAAMAWPDILLLGYGLPAAALTLLTLAAVLRLRLLSFRSKVVVDPEWLTALARAQQRFGFKYGTALLASRELRSPVSWGVIRPVIILDNDVIRDAGRAEAIIAHELAHVARLDWPALVLGRLVCGLYWFNPLVWMLVRKAHELSEQAADDAVLRSQVSSTDYADILVQAARHSTSPLLLAANGVAPSSSSLGRRILRVLDPGSSRVPVRLGWAIAGLAATLGLGTGMAAIEPRMTGEPAPLATFTAAPPIIRATNHGPGALRTEPAPANAPVVVPQAAALKETPAPSGPVPVAPSGPLYDQTPEVRAQAARALGDLGATERIAEVAHLLKDPSAYVRREAAHALGDLQDPASRPALEAALNDEDPGVRAKAGWALRQVAEAESILRKYGGN
jgi:beta-lactamase regulating signal transducer with metallopeptidase domain